MAWSGRSRSRGRARGLAVLGVLACAGCCVRDADFDRAFAVDASQAARILDADGRPTEEGCRAVCLELAGTIPPDGSVRSDAGNDFDRWRFEAVTGCGLVSNGRSLEVNCHFGPFYSCELEPGGAGGVPETAGAETAGVPDTGGRGASPAQRSASASTCRTNAAFSSV
jgi:hypothetical protein